MKSMGLCKMLGLLGSLGENSVRRRGGQCRKTPAHNYEKRSEGVDIRGNAARLPRQPAAVRPIQMVVKVC
jgi:hypothetical protein